MIQDRTDFLIFCWVFVHIFVFAEEAFDSIPAEIPEPRSVGTKESQRPEPEQSSSSIGE